VTPPTGEFLAEDTADLPDGRSVVLRYYRTGRATGRRIVVWADGGGVLFDSGDQYDTGNAWHALGRWVSTLQ